MKSELTKGNLQEKQRLSEALDMVASRGFTIGQNLRDSDRFMAYQLRKDGKKYFFKIIKGVAVGKIKAEVWFSGFINSSPANDLIIAPKIVQSGPSWYISEFLEGSPLCPEATCYESDLTPYAGAMGNMLVKMDSLKLPPAVKSAVKDKYDVGPVNRISSVAVEKGVITPALRSEALRLVGNKLKNMDKRLQHGDFTPWHIFDLGDGKYGLIDSEHAGRWSRFNDLASIYSRLFNRCNTPETAAQTLVYFISIIDLDKTNFFRQFLPIITSKALYGCYDSTRDWVKHDYKKHSRELLERCLAKDIKTLTDI